MGIALLDSSVVISYLDADDGYHTPAVASVRSAARAGSLVVSMITLAEVLTGAKLGRHDLASVRGFFTRVIERRLAVDDAVAERAADIRVVAPALRMPDALILATGELHADLVLTGTTVGRGFRVWTAESISSPEPERRTPPARLRRARSSRHVDALSARCVRATLDLDEDVLLAVRSWESSLGSLDAGRSTRRATAVPDRRGSDHHHIVPGGATHRGRRDRAIERDEPPSIGTARSPRAGDR